MDIVSRYSLLERLLNDARRQKLSRGEVMPDSEVKSFLHLIITGYIKRYSIANDGAQSIQVIYGPGDAFPLTPVFESLYSMTIYHGSGSFYYEAMTEVELRSLNLLSLNDAVEAEPLLHKDLMQIAGDRLNSNIQQLENMSLRSTNRKIAHLLAYYAQKFGKDTKMGRVIEIPLTHQTIADSLHVARETVSRRMTRLEEKNIIISEKQIIVKDMTALKKEYSHVLGSD